MMPRPCDKAVFQHVHCIVCGQLGHIVCKSQPSLQGSTYGRCAICGSPGHSYKMCPDRYTHRTVHSGEKGTGSGACFICGEFVGVDERSDGRVISLRIVRIGGVAANAR